MTPNQFNLLFYNNMRKQLINQFNSLLVDSDRSTIENVMFAPVRLADDSDLAYHRCAVVSGGSIYMTGLCILGSVIDGVPIAGVYDSDGKLIGFK